MCVSRECQVTINNPWNYSQVPARYTCKGDIVYKYFKCIIFLLPPAAALKVPYVFRLSNLLKLDLQVDCGTDFRA